MYSNDLKAFEKKWGFFLVPFRRLVFHTFQGRVLDIVISTYFLSKILIGRSFINLCTFHVKKNSARLQ